MNFYLLVDLQKSLYYVAPFHVDKDSPYLISFDERYKADIFLRKINSQNYTSPVENKNSYNYIGYDYCPLLKGKVHFYSPLKY